MSRAYKKTNSSKLDLHVAPPISNNKNKKRLKLYTSIAIYGVVLLTRWVKQYREKKIEIFM